MSTYAGPVQDLIDELGRLPGVGPKSAQRIAFHLLKLPKADALRLASSIVEVKDKVTFCTRCFNIAEGPECELCNDDRRDSTILCVVGTAASSVEYRRVQGRYHVLQGHQPDRRHRPRSARIVSSWPTDGEGVARSSCAPTRTSRARPRDVPQPAHQAARHRVTPSPACPWATWCAGGSRWGGHWKVGRSTGTGQACPDSVNAKRIDSATIRGQWRPLPSAAWRPRRAPRGRER